MYNYSLLYFYVNYCVFLPYEIKFPILSKSSLIFLDFLVLLFSPLSTLFKRSEASSLPGLSLTIGCGDLL